MNLDINLLENVQRTPKGLNCACPACVENGCSTSHRHLFIYPDGKYGCVVDKSHSKRIFELVGIKKGEPQPEAAPEPKARLSTPKIYSKDLLLSLFPKYDLFIKRGISKEVLQEVQCGLSMGGAMNKRIVFPAFDLKGNIIGFSGRWYQEVPPEGVVKWKHFQSTKNRVYNAYLSGPIIREKNSVILVESIGDLLSLFTARIRNVLVLYGKNLSHSIINYLISINIKSIIISTNNDEPGIEAAEDINIKLQKFFDKDKIKIQLPVKKDWGECSAEEIRRQIPG